MNIWQSLCLNFASGIFVVCILLAAGKKMRLWFDVTGVNNSINVFLDFGLGIFVFNLIWMGLGLVRLWIEPLWLLGILLITLFLLKDILTLRHYFCPFSKTYSSFFLPIGFLYLIFLLFHSLLPETFYDSLNYFLGMPSFWLLQHGISDYPTHILSGYFHGGSLFFLNGLIFGGTEAAKVLNLAVFMVLGLGIYGWVKDIAGSLAGTLAGLTLFTFPLLFLNTLAVRVDGLLSFSLLLFFYAFNQACQKNKNSESWVALTSLFAGLAITIKPTALVGIGAALLAFFWQYGFKRTINPKKIGFLVLAFPILQVAPWLVKNACFAGNPFFPYAISIMGGRQFPAWSYIRLLHENQQFLPMDKGLWSLIDLPWRLTMPQSGDGQFIGPLFLVFLPLLFFARTDNKTIGFLIKTMILSFAFGLTLSHMLRFSIPAFILALMVLTLAFISEKNDWLRLSWGTAMIFWAVMFFIYYLGLSSRFFDGMGVWSGRETVEEYLNRRMPNSYEPLVTWTDQNLPKDARLLIVGDARGMYYQRIYYANSVFDEPFFSAAAHGEPDAAGILKRLQKMGITHIVFNITEGERISTEYHQYDLNVFDWKKLNDFERLGLEPVYWKDFLAVYKVKTQLSPSSDSIVNPFSFFSKPAHDFIESSQLHHNTDALKALSQELILFPNENYWIGKMNVFKRNNIQEQDNT